MIKKSFLWILVIFFCILPSLISGSVAQGEKISLILEKILPDLIKIRREIHAHPELGFQEKRTAALVSEYLKKLGLEVREGIGKTGVRGILRGSKPGPTVGMRADMDALPITEETDLPFASREKILLEGKEIGLMHACGHDIHTTVMLGVAHVLSQLKEELSGTVIFVAQPAEEKGDGAAAMLKDGLFEDIKPEAMFAFHVDDTLKAGMISYTPGYSGANCDGFQLKIKSQGCHGAHPDDCVDPIVVGSQVVLALQVMVSRELDVKNDTVITVGVFHSGSAPNIIPKEAKLEATIRSYGEEQRKLIREKVERIISNLCEANGASFELNYFFGTPALYNNPELLDKILPSVERVLGGKEYLFKGYPSMGGEDFSYFAREIPAVMLGLGVAPHEKASPLHSPTFVADEESIPLGIKVMSTLIYEYLMNEGTA